MEVETLVKSPEGQELAVLCLDFGYKLAEHPRDLTRHQINFLLNALTYRINKMSYEQNLEPGTTRIIFE